MGHKPRIIKLKCSLANCNFETISEVQFRGHLVKHDIEQIHDFAFDHGLLDESVSNRDVSSSFHTIVRRIMEYSKNG